VTVTLTAYVFAVFGDPVMSPVDELILRPDGSPVALYVNV
jgi:hypothetical protein